MDATNQLPNGSLLVYETKGGKPKYRAKWRDRTGKQCAPTIGPAWLVKDGDGWAPRPGRVRSGFYDEQRAYLRMAELIAERDATLRSPPPAPVTFEELADAWLEHLSRGERAKPSTLRDYRLMLDKPRPLARGKGETKARIMREFGSREAASITTDQVAAFLDRLVIEGLSARNVNRHRQVLHAAFAFAMKPGSFGLPMNPVTGTDRQREDGAKAINPFTTEDLAGIERVARAGGHRERPEGFYGPQVLAEWERINEQDAAMFMLAVYTGLRQGELRALRWRHVFIDAQRLSVEEAISAGEVCSTKSRRVRSVPLTEAACELLLRIADRGKWLDPFDLVFCSSDGDVLNESALRRRFKRAQKEAGVRVRRFHDLRHTFGSIAVRKFDPVTVQALMGHSSLSTTERYMHSRPRPDDAARLAAAFASDSEIQTGLTRTKTEPKRSPRLVSKFKLTTKIKR